MQAHRIGDPTCECVACRVHRKEVRAQRDYDPGALVVWSFAVLIACSCVAGSVWLLRLAIDAL